MFEMKTDPTVKLKLDFCDLGRIINGVHGYPVEKRPFARAFTPEKIVAGAAKLSEAWSESRRPSCCSVSQACS